MAPAARSLLVLRRCARIPRSPPFSGILSLLAAGFWTITNHGSGKCLEMRDEKPPYGSPRFARGLSSSNGGLRPSPTLVSKATRKSLLSQAGKRDPPQSPPTPAPVSTWPSLVLWGLGVVALLAVAWRLRKKWGRWPIRLGPQAILPSLLRPCRRALETVKQLPGCGPARCYPSSAVAWHALRRLAPVAGRPLTDQSGVYRLRHRPCFAHYHTAVSELLWGFAIAALLVFAWRIRRWRELDRQAGCSSFAVVLPLFCCLSLPSVGCPVSRATWPVMSKTTHRDGR